MMASFVKRKQLIIDKQAQLKVLAVIAIYMMVAVLLTALLIFLPSFIKLSGSEITAEKYNAAKEVLVLHQRFWPAVLIVVVLLGGHSIFMFHRLFGPLYRFKCVMQEITGGDLSCNFRLRDKDSLQEEARIMNEMINSLRGKIGTFKNDSQTLFQAIERAASEVDRQDFSPERVKSALSDVRQMEEKIRQGLDAFRTDNG